MTSIILIIEHYNEELLKKTIESIEQNTDIEQVHKIIALIGDTCSLHSKGLYEYHHYENVYQINKIIESLDSDNVVIIGNYAKFKPDWLQVVDETLKGDEKSLVTPIVYDLDHDLFASKEPKCKGFSIDYDLNIINKAGHDSPIVSPRFFAAKTIRLKEIGLFDNGMEKYCTSTIELSIRNWLLGGSVKQCDCEIAVADIRQESEIDKARTINVCMGRRAGFFNIFRSKIDYGRIDETIKLYDKKSRDIDWYFDTLLPELSNMHKLYAIASEKDIAIVSTGSSIDLIDNREINSNEILIGVDYMASVYDCDFIVTDSVDIVNDLRDVYPSRKFVLPIALENRLTGGKVPTEHIMSGSYLFDIKDQSDIKINIKPPFINFRSNTLSAIHLALFMKPKSIKLYGFDNNLINGRSHTTKIEYYGDGKLLPNTTATKNNYDYQEYGLRALRELAMKHGIPLLRINHA